ncbi:MmgE/PrpD family protein (plasmid) [Ensifer adhaerens]|uniref:MmgE/PrpD family protein n=1 Tax=Ensifer adhaerens TaxID=106592 RepID=UPI0023AA115A|nr:MmgE/PrpD family protein [Ensifer adhaerens]WDZ81686.1 MmgE/PrpD family protein [Ensifer adhaerens]
MPLITENLAEHILATSRCSPSCDDRNMALKCMLDLIGAAIAGREMQGPLAARRTACDLMGSGASPIWATGETASVLGALLANTSAASALDLDDGHRLARGHPGAAVIPTVLAILPATNARAADVFSAISVGYDVGVRIAAAQMPATISTRQTGRWASVAAAAAAACLLMPREDQIAHALAIAAVLAPNQQANGSSGYSRLTGNDVKEGIAWSAVLGLTAVNLALAGHTGPADVFDHLEYYDRRTILKGLGSRSHLAGTYFKPYACCRYIHAALDAFLDLVSEGKIVAEDITGVEIETFGWALRLGNELQPATIVDVQYSLPYCIAVAAIEGRDALTPVAPGLLERRDLTSFAGKVKLSVSSEIDALFPGETLARVTVSTVSGRHVSDVRGPFGDPQRPMSFADIEEKFLRVTSQALSPERQRDIVDGILDMPADHGSGLLAALR